ncbi:ionotropic receptor 21a-like [Portunus trituberculatus]|uniref:ionotropic receptor 21a-like n=1 Tax=Portunus trituberculatus TaxID=210409 RepID=UPI001E1CC695|nr:ionotropic receptor 21a-like [Portunus trituberculatus]
MKVPLEIWLQSLFVMSCVRRGAMRNPLSVQGMEASQSTRPVSNLLLESVHDSPQLTQLLQHIVENFLKDCDLWLLYPPGETLVILLAANLQLQERPIRTVALETSEEGVEVPELTITSAPACSAYIIFGYSGEFLRSLVESSGFESQLHYLGRFIFVTGTAAGAARLILDNPVMAWRPHALVIKEFQEASGVSYEVWSHEVFRGDVEERVRVVERWRQGEAQWGVDLFPDKLSDFGGNELRALTFHYPPSIVESNKAAEGTQTQRFDGVEIRLMQTVAEVLNFRLHLANPSDGRMWYGIFDDLQHRRAFMGAANFFVTTSALQVVDMTVQHDVEPGCFITPLPAPLPRLVALVYPFTPTVWLVTVASLVCGTLLLFGVSLAAYHLSRRHQRKPITYADSLLYGAGIFVAVGMPNVPRSNATRGYFIMWVWYGVLLTAVYRSSLTAFLTIPLAQTPIDTLHQLEASDIPAVGSVGINFLRQLEASSDPVVRRLANRYQAVSTPEEGLVLTAKRKYALMENRLFLDHAIAANFTNRLGEETLHVMRECFQAYRIALVMPKKSPYKPNFDAVVVQVVEAGLIRHWNEDILRRSRRVSTEEPEDADNERQFTVDDLQGAWLILALGYLTALTAFLVELAICQSHSPRLAGHRTKIDSQRSSDHNNFRSTTHAGSGICVCC